MIKRTPEQVAAALEFVVRETCNSEETVREYNLNGIELPEATCAEVTNNGDDDFFADVNKYLRDRAGIVILVNKDLTKVKAMPLKAWLIMMVRTRDNPEFKGCRDDMLEKIKSLGDDTPSMVKETVYSELVDVMTTNFINERYGGRLGLLKAPASPAPTDSKKWS